MAFATGTRGGATWNSLIQAQGALLGLESLLGAIHSQSFQTPLKEGLYILNCNQSPNMIQGLFLDEGLLEALGKEPCGRRGLLSL